MTHPTHNTQAEPTQWRKKPVVVEARRFWNDESSYDLLQWINEGQHAIGREFASWENDALIVPTLEGQHIASYGDWVIRGVKGEHYPCKPDIFAATYEPASTPPAPPAADVAGLVAELGRLLAKITAPEGNYTASDRTEFTMQMLNGINKLAALAQPKQPDHLPDAGDMVQPIPMVLYCPNCGTQHIDAPEPGTVGMVSAEGFEPGREAWTNPPHRSHLCHSCRTIWRPADVPTVGVAELATQGKADTWPAKHNEEVVAQLARVELPPLSDAEYRRGYRDGYNRRDDEVKGALA